MKIYMKISAETIFTFCYPLKLIPAKNAFGEILQIFNFSKKPDFLSAYFVWSFHCLCGCKAKMCLKQTVYTSCRVKAKVFFRSSEWPHSRMSKKMRWDAINGDKNARSRTVSLERHSGFCICLCIENTQKRRCVKNEGDVLILPTFSPHAPDHWLAVWSDCQIANRCFPNAVRWSNKHLIWSLLMPLTCQ